MSETELLTFRPSKASELKLFFWGSFFILAGIAALIGLSDTPLIGLILLLFALILFLRAWIRVISTGYRLTDQRFFRRCGLIAKNEEEIELYRVQDVKLNQSILQRLLGIGDITVVSSDRTAPFLLIRGVRNPAAIKETLRSAYRDARKAEGVKSAEFVSQ